jgi:hypothetical protein
MVKMKIEIKNKMGLTISLMSICIGIVVFMLSFVEILSDVNVDTLLLFLYGVILIVFGSYGVSLTELDIIL